MNRRALIGHTGFVGGNLSRQAEFEDRFNSLDIHSIAGRHYDLIVCAGAPGLKWRANQEPERDRASLELLSDSLARVTTTRFVLISTVDVYPAPREVDETSPIDERSLSPYGLHRLLLERFVENRFAATIVRLPALFGPGLKKNAIHDLMHGNRLESLCPRSAFQFHDLETLWRDIRRALDSDLSRVNLATEPVSLGEVAEQVFGLRLPDDPRLAATSYDFRTRHAALWGRSDGYIAGREQVLEALARFAAAEGFKHP